MPASPTLQAFLDDLLREFPPLRDVDDGGDGPWVVGAEPGDIHGAWRTST